MKLRMLAILALSLGVVGCTSGRQSAAGFRLPENGDIERGKVAFATYECHTCHTVSGGGVPAPSTPDLMTVRLWRSDGNSNRRLFSEVDYPPLAQNSSDEPGNRNDRGRVPHAGLHGNDDGSRSGRHHQLPAVALSPGAVTDPSIAAVLVRKGKYYVAKITLPNGFFPAMFGGRATRG